MIDDSDNKFPHGAGGISARQTGYALFEGALPCGQIDIRRVIRDYRKAIRNGHFISRTINPMDPASRAIGILPKRTSGNNADLMAGTLE